MHSFKHAATIQYTHSNNPYPLLLRVDNKAGHGTGKPVEKRYDVFTTCLTRYPLIEICVFLSLEFRKRLTNGASSLRPWNWSGKALRGLHAFFVLFSLQGGGLHTAFSCHLCSGGLVIIFRPCPRKVGLFSGNFIAKKDR